MPEPLVAERTGLFTRHHTAVPLAGVSIEAELSSLCARVVITQRYVNQESTPIEAMYLFPLDEGAAVCGFEAIVDGTLVVGEVKERDAAFRQYDDAMARGDGAFLLDRERADVFQASVGNLPPGKEALLKITYVSELAVEGNSLRFTIPTTVAPRYAPAEDHLGVGRSDADTLNPPRAWQVPYGLTLSVAVTMPGAIRSLACPSHPVTVAMSGRTGTVSLSRRDSALDGDFVLSIDAEGLDRPHAWVERADDGSETIALAFVPSLGTTPGPSEIVFLVDRSGSMEGTSIEEVRNALQLCLRSMIPGCAFNIVGFGATHQALFSKSRIYDEKSLAKASEHVSELAADLGGTEILPALESVLVQPPFSRMPRQVMVLTDGEVSNTDAVLELVGRHAATTRLFAFGIGASPSRHLVSGMARAGRGAAEFIHPGERIEPKVVRQFGRLLSPALSNVRVTWDGLDVMQATSSIPPVFAGDRLLLYGFVKTHQGPGSARAQLTADSASGSISVDAAIDRANAKAGRTVGALAARSRVRELEESPDWLKPRASRQPRMTRSAVSEEIISLSTRYGVLSRETSFVAVERRDTPVEGEIQLRRIPIAVPRDWTRVVERASGGSSRLTQQPQAALAPPTATFDRAESSAHERMSWLPDRLTLFSGKRSRLEAGPTSADGGFHALVKLQRADGSWELTKELAQAVGHALPELEKAGRSLGSGREASRAWATALALAWLSAYAPREENEWRMLAAKAAAWLDAVEVRPASGKAWMEEAIARVASSSI